MNMNKLIQSFKFFPLMGFVFVIIGCSTSINPGKLAKTPEQYAALAQQNLKQGSETQYPHSLEFRLLAAENFIKARMLREAGNTLREILTQEPAMELSLRKILFEARLALLKEETQRAQALVKSMLNDVSKLTGSQSQHSGTTHTIALLLPSRGPHAEAAKTIREGFLAAYYKAQSGNESKIQMIDTSETGGVNAAYQKAIAEHVDLIVGPLTKPEVQTLADMPLDIPVLALNTLKTSKVKSSHLYQFGLMPEDEVYAAAQHARQQGRQRALIIAPQSEWGQRMAKEFQSSFEAQRGRVIKTVFISPHQELSHKIQAILQSIRKDQRSDIDMIFLAASTDLGRQIKPLLNLHQAVPLPVYATATIYSGTKAPHLDQDLEGVRFCDMPWILGQSSSDEAKPTLSASHSARSPRYFALGVDAYHLATQLVNHSIPISGMSGLTGQLKIDSKQHIQRRLICAKFEHGIPIPD